MANTTSASQEKSISAGRLIGLAIPMRLTVDTAMRMFYPYLPELSRGLGITLAQGGLLMSARSAMVLLSPIFGQWNDRRGPRVLLSLALVMQGLSLLYLSFVQGLLAALPAVMALGLTSAAFIPTMQATISEHVPFQRRGRILGIVEYSWALTGLVIVPLLGLLMVARGWQAPLRLFGLLSLIVAPLPFLLPGERRLLDQARISLGNLAGLIRHNRSVQGVILVNGLMFISAESFFVTYGAWLEQAFGMAPDAIGRIAGFMGLAELMASVTSSLFIDRIGKRRGVGAGLLAMTLAMLALPWLGVTATLATAGMFAFSMAFEFTIVSNIGLMSEQVPQARGTVLSLGVMGSGIARTLSGYGGVALFEWQGIAATAIVAATATAAGLLVLLRWVKERAEE